MDRRKVLGIGAVGTAGAVAVGAVGARLIGTAEASERPPDSAAAVGFHGEHQAGIITPAQDRLHFVTFDVTTDKRDELVRMLKTWTEAARRMTAGRDAGPVGAVDGDRYAPPD